MPSHLKLASSVSNRERASPSAFVCSWATDGLDAAWAHVAGELDVETTPHLEQALRACLETARLVVLDLREVTFIGSCGVATIVDASITARRNGSRLLLLPGPPEIEQAFRLPMTLGRVEVVHLKTTAARPGLRLAP
jgi:anti-anti-sigma factor